MIKALALPDIKERMAGLGAEVVGNTPEEAAALIKLEVAKYTKVANAAHISAD
jgi:tripartite-type tricarboxylate transporter receptor subunit TctC